MCYMAVVGLHKTNTCFGCWLHKLKRNRRHRQSWLHLAPQVSQVICFWQQQNAWLFRVQTSRLRFGWLIVENAFHELHKVELIERVRRLQFASPFRTENVLYIRWRRRRQRQTSRRCRWDTYKWATITSYPTKFKVVSIWLTSCWGVLCGFRLNERDTLLFMPIWAVCSMIVDDTS